MSPNPAANQDFQNAISLTLLLRSLTRCWLQHRCSSTGHLNGLSLVVSRCADIEYWTAAIVLQWTASWTVDEMQLLLSSCSGRLWQRIVSSYCRLADEIWLPPSSCSGYLWQHAAPSLFCSLEIPFLLYCWRSVSCSYLVVSC